MGRKLHRIIPRIKSVFQYLPIRLGRMGRHLFYFNKLGPLPYCYEFGILFLELFGLAEWYETLNDLLKPTIRPLTDREIAEAQLAFGNNIDYKRVLIDESAQIGCKKGNFAYVSFYLINYWGKMDDSHLMHELAHIWQYERIGARYMPRAVIAQHSKEGYNYGGISRLSDEKNTLKSFNMEQQAEIFTDFYRLRKGRTPQYGNATPKDIAIYEQLINEDSCRL
jgi:hypothetical protein